jgi:DNA-binding transcriptional LysR family regulator
MNLKQIHFVLSVAETSSFSKAAKLCHATQPTLSNAISQLEDELGGKLFVRTTRRVSLTAFGEYMLPFLNQLLSSQHELKEAAYSFHHPEHSLLRIGLSPLVDMKLVNQILLPFRRANPDINIFFKECLMDEMQQRMQNQQIDFAIVPQSIQIAETESTFFYQEPLFYLPMENATHIKKSHSIEITAVPPDPIILTGGGCGLNGSLENLFKQHHSSFNAYPGQALSYKVIEEWASLGIGAGILPRAKLSENNKSLIPLLLENGEAATFSYYWLWGEKALNNSDLSLFIEFLNIQLPALVKGKSLYSAA